MLRIHWSPLLLLIALVASAGYGQTTKVDLRRDPIPRIAPAHEVATGVVTPTPEMWFYEQERLRHDSPKMAVRRKAELRGLQRQERLASLEWYGLSNSRPTAAITPICGGSYAPGWASNTVDPWRWRSPAAPVVVLRPGTGPY